MLRSPVNFGRSGSVAFFLGMRVVAGSAGGFGAGGGEGAVSGTVAGCAGCPCCSVAMVSCNIRIWDLYDSRSDLCSDRIASSWLVIPVIICTNVAMVCPGEPPSWLSGTIVVKVVES
jgi:hypothetical protein